ncbi:MAG TPA: right-handed parallel beta-helix repeat-containing protein [Armatimonadota bacterium]|jgi:parallel beta-helix repeat protein
MQARSLALIILLPFAAHAAPVIPKDGMILKESATLEPGTYALPHGIVIGADNVTLDAKGAVFTGGGDGQAVFVKGNNGVTIRGLEASRYKWGVRVEGGKNIKVQDCRIRDTPEAPPDDTWLDIWLGPKDAYGGAIILFDVKGGLVSGNDVQHQQNGVMMYSCSGLTVEKNNASFQSGFGIHMYGSSDNIVQDNIADWCNRIHKRGERYYYPGADATGILMVVNCSRNKILRNFFRGGGDGVFVAGYNPDLGKVPCNDNLFEDNDCSYSPNNAFEATFCKGNIFRNNRAGFSNYGFWLGYSIDTKIEGNEVRRNRIAGIAIEHGLRNEIADNHLSSNGRGIALWANAAAQFNAAWPDQATSANNVIRGNSVCANGIGLLVKVEGQVTPKSRPHDDTVSGNTFYGNDVGALVMNADAEVIKGNRFENNTVAGLRLESNAKASITGNAFADQPLNAWSDSAGVWDGNQWAGAVNGPVSIAGGPGKDEHPAKEVTAPASTTLSTMMDVLRGTPR